MAATGQNIEGVRLYEQGHYQAALQRFQQSISHDPVNPDAYYNMAATIHHMGEQTGNASMYNQAETLYNQCLDLNPNHVACHRGLAVLLAETDRADRAFTLLRNWATENPHLDDARIELARLYEEFGDKDTARLHLVSALQLDQFDTRTHNALARLSEEAGDYQQAMVNYQRSVALNNMQPEIAARLATLQRSANSAINNLSVPGGTQMVNTPGQGRY